MDITKTIQELYAEKQKLERVIASLEQLRGASADIPSEPPKRRGRKFMDAREREEVSARMKKYWASRRNSRAAGV